MFEKHNPILEVAIYHHNPNTSLQVSLHRNVKRILKGTETQLKRVWVHRHLNASVAFQMKVPHRLMGLPSHLLTRQNAIPT